jgi:hypothetical protein
MERQGRLQVAYCARPGCQGRTAAWLTYDYAAQHVWLDDLPSSAGDQWALCAGHARRLRAPQGWTQEDRRVAQGPRFDPPASLVS